jgi:hypothetical protein
MLCSAVCKGARELILHLHEGLDIACHESFHSACTPSQQFCGTFGWCRAYVHSDKERQTRKNGKFDLTAVPGVFL